MRDHRGTAPNSFGELLRQAFAPHIDPDKAAGMAKDMDSRFYEGWEREVLGPFYARYGIWDV